ncbi:hypothetical protein [Cyanobium sp. Morenito 9A2]|uniref:hypothetical protein n=1 Tax=Cyanobium sp. Morenito 9A2 TaxID=2823718 RepID=UPI0020CC01C1|nr:hypothetical protein [Cyanobium sp. Morenito 9A2]MCP9849230.1 hypothetical protein [Cyanobium sp. Morenito 9A2]
MKTQSPTLSERHHGALHRTAQLLRRQARKGKPLACLAPLIAERFGPEAAAVVRGSVDTIEGLSGAGEAPRRWPKTRSLASVGHKREGSLRVTAVDKAHNGRDRRLDARRLAPVGLAPAV